MSTFATRQKELNRKLKAQRKMEKRKQRRELQKVKVEFVENRNADPR